MKHMASGSLVLILACAPAMAEETATEKNESIERYILAEQQASFRAKATGNSNSLPAPFRITPSFFPSFDAPTPLPHPKLFILYHNLKLCD